jgi:hypothetical protein
MDGSVADIFLLLFQQTQLFVNGPVGKSEVKGHNYIHDWYEDEQAQRPAIAGVRENPAANQQLYCENDQNNKRYNKSDEDCKNRSYVLTLLSPVTRVHIFSFQLRFNYGAFF